MSPFLYAIVSIDRAAHRTHKLAEAAFARHRLEQDRTMMSRHPSPNVILPREAAKPSSRRSIETGFLTTARDNIAVDDLARDDFARDDFFEGYFS